ncbi:DNA polymerase Y family protein [Chitiniphilus purpureus]|uniref:DNA polymerase Y family protein n=1 Tax=Chitiniphilus purpureus TaxID=2981137 RepID=A0ABY6DMD9_9NEIS|nr:DNA polymerase Y family protein [Chitiniphilus sp. CD1]UXY15378.1 DNA polymerase Y family protein [Chitiniphilus sp. CD1]
MLWLALHLPRLALDVFPPPPPACPDSDAIPAVRPRIVVASQGRGERLVLADALAASLGLQPDMKLSAALALVNQLVIHRRNPQAEAAALAQLAGWALRFTPTVVLAEPDTLLLEIGGCLAYFGGLARLRGEVESGAQAQGYAVTSAVAPTPLAAQWLACQGRVEPVLQADLLHAVLAPLPLTVLPLAPAQAQTLQQLGLRRLGDVLALPRAGLARRAGRTLPLLLERALGALPDPRPVFVAPDRFERTIDLDWPVETVPVFLMLAQRLLAAQEAFLSGRGLGVQTVVFRFTHEMHAPTAVTISAGRPLRDAAAWLAIVRERMARERLAAPAASVTLLAEALHPLDGRPQHLFGAQHGQGMPTLLLDRMAARLGADAVCGVATVPDHRPERAWAEVAPGTTSSPLPLGMRPGWLLPAPRRLPLRDELPWHGEPLRCLGRAERIESGWWDGGDVTRDYYVAQGPSGARYWIFQDRTAGDWWLHGMFA